MRAWWLCLLLPVWCARADTNRSATLFPFVLPWNDADTNLVNLSAWQAKPAGQDGFVVAHDGHFYAGHQRLRFFGVNLVGPGAFPQHADADQIAARLAKFGINCVRFHHLDATWAPLIDYAAGNSRHLNAAALDRLDYLIAQLQRHGIYADLNLLVSRDFRAADGLPAEIKSVDWKGKHMLGFFDPAILRLQQEYARQLLTHTNAYTGLPYTHDPAVAIVEINNENGLIHAWLDGQLDALPESFAGVLRAKWNAWLRASYPTTDRLRAAWQTRDEPLGGELLTQRWMLEEHAGARASETNGHITVTQTGLEGWHVQFNHPGVAVQLDQPVTLTFRAKADPPGEVAVALMQAHAPWRDIGLGTRVQLTSAWQEFRFTFSPTQTDTNARINFGDLGRRLGNVWLADVSFRPGGVIGLAAGERIETGTLPLFPKANLGQRTATAQHDWMRFLWETEDRYWQTMNRYLKDDLQVRANIIGTIVGCSPPNIQAQLDAVDAHAYWQHPHFPGKPWDAEDWTVSNQSMVNELGGVLPGLALKRVAGKPFCVTEYNHPAPNTFGSEGFLLLAAYASLQDWDAIFSFAYSHRAGDWNAQRMAGFFDIDQHPTKMATLPAAAALFTRGDVHPARERITVALPVEHERDLLLKSHAWELVDAGSVGLPPTAALVHRVALADRTRGAFSPAGARCVADTGELTWTRGLVTVNAPRSKAIIGISAGQRFELGDCVIEPGTTRQNGWSAITLTELQPHRWLVTATGYAENTGMIWKNAAHDSVGRNWGAAPSLVEGIPAKITLPGVARAWALDERGQRREELPVHASTIEIGPQYRTLWYEVEQR